MNTIYMQGFRRSGSLTLWPSENSLLSHKTNAFVELWAAAQKLTGNETSILAPDRAAARRYFVKHPGAIPEELVRHAVKAWSLRKRKRRVGSNHYHYCRGSIFIEHFLSKQPQIARETAWFTCPQPNFGRRILERAKARCL